MSSTLKTGSDGKGADLSSSLGNGAGGGGGGMLPTFRTGNGGNGADLVGFLGDGAGGGGDGGKPTVGTRWGTLGLTAFSSPAFFLAKALIAVCSRPLNSASNLGHCRVVTGAPTGGSPGILFRALTENRLG